MQFGIALTIDSKQYPLTWEYPKLQTEQVVAFEQNMQLLVQLAAAWLATQLPLATWLNPDTHF